ncbi:MAG: PIN domain-containing protein [bacterium]|nr:PIN domain-containing protein [bacterium]
MKLIVDSNIIFTFFWEESVFSMIYLRNDLYLCTPEVFIEELNKYEEEIQSKAKLNKQEFLERKKELLNNLVIVPIEKYKENLRVISEISNSLSEKEKMELKNDADFLALALKENCLLWSNDKLLKKQKSVEIITTRELISLLS